MERQLEERATAVHEAEAEASSRENEILELKDNLESVHERAEQKAASEQSLSEELERVRVAKDEELQSAQELVEHLQSDVESKKQQIDETQANSSEKEALLQSLKLSLEEVEDRAERASREAERASKEVEERRAEESLLIENVEAKEQALTAAMQEIDSLRQVLKDKEDAVEKADEESARREQQILDLQSEWESLRKDSKDTATDERALLEKLKALQTEQATGKQELEHAHDEARAIRTALESRSTAILAVEKAAKKSSAKAKREPTPVRLVFVVVAALMAVSGIGYQLFRTGDLQWPQVGPQEQTPSQIAQEPKPLPIEPIKALSGTIPDFDPGVAPPARVVRFSADASVGGLRARPWDGSGGAWRSRGEARGPIWLAAGQVLELRTKDGGNTDLSSLSKLEHDTLHTLILRGEEITDEQFSFVTHLTSLQELVIVSTTVSEEQLASLTNFRHLRSLNLKGTPVSAATVNVLASMQWLRELDLRDTGVEEDSLRALHATLTRCAIVPRPRL